MLMHGESNNEKKPVIDYDLSRRYTDTYKAMEELVHQGKTKFIGEAKPLRQRYRLI